MIEDTMDSMESSIEEVKNKFYGVAVGKVINLLDPMTLGRVQVQLPFIDSLDLSPWARVAVPMAGITHGTYFIPNIGDEVLVAFGIADKAEPAAAPASWRAYDAATQPVCDARSENGTRLSTCQDVR